MPRLIRSVLDKAGLDSTAGLDVVGDILIIRFPGSTPHDKRKVAEALLGEMKSVKCVFEQEGGIEGELRLKPLRHLAGEERTLTTHRENGCAFRVDVARCYFSPRLSTERLRVADSVRREESVLNMFAGVGPFSILIARRRRAKVTSCELNVYACELHRENNGMNKVSDLIDVVNADAMDLPRLVTKKFERILMPHPSAADRFLPVALSLVKPRGVIHYYRHVLGRDEAEATDALREELSAILPPEASYGIRRVREVGPRWIELAAEIRPAS